MSVTRAMFRSHTLVLTALLGCTPATPNTAPEATSVPAAIAPVAPATPTPVTSVAPVTPAAPVPTKAVVDPIPVAPTRAQIAELSAQIAEGRRQTRAGAYPAAIAAFTRGLQSVANNPRALAGRGYAHLLAGALPEAARDLEDALPRTPDDTLKAAIYYNLGLVAEKRGDAEAAGRSFARSNVLRPSKSAAEKLHSKTVCPVEIDDTVHDALSIAGWRALWQRWHIFEDAAPASEAAARALMCTKEWPCDGEPPWAIVVQDPDDGLTRRIALVQPAPANGLRVQVLDEKLAISVHCDDKLGTFTWASRAPLLVGSPSIDRGLFFEDGCEDDNAECYELTCERGSDDFTRTIVLDPGDLRRLLVVTDRSGALQPVALEVDAAGARLHGGACDRIVTWARASP